MRRLEAVADTRFGVLGRTNGWTHARADEGHFYTSLLRLRRITKRTNGKLSRLIEIISRKKRKINITRPKANISHEI